MLVNVVFVTLFALSGVFSENVFELVSFVFVSTGLSSFIVYQFFFDRKNTEELVLWIRFICVCIFAPLNALFAFLVFRSFGWRIYRKIGADVELTKIYRSYQQMVSLVKFDLQFGTNIVIVAGFFLYENYELYIDIAVITVTVLWAGLGWAAVRLEARSATIIFLCTSFIEPAYVIYKAVHYILNPPEKKIFVPLIYYFGVSLIVTRIVLVIFFSHCDESFWKGTQESV